MSRVCRRGPSFTSSKFGSIGADIASPSHVACSPSSVYRVLKAAGLLSGQTPNITKNGTTFVQPLSPHEHWHVDVSYLNVAGTYYFLWALANRQSPSDAALDLCQRLAIPLPHLSQTTTPRNKEEEPVANPLDNCKMPPPSASVLIP